MFPLQDQTPDLILDLIHLSSLSYARVIWTLSSLRRTDFSLRNKRRQLQADWNPF
jgi:hypothetical protein